jgi:hypothetical protein
VRRSTQALVETLIDVLNLPIWRRRSDLYAAWIGAQIVKALGSNTRVLSADGRLILSFSGTHLATRTSGTTNLHVWSELRSAWTFPKAPREKRRRRAIQPDYSLTLEPVTSAKSSVLVVEVKHYLKHSPVRFAAALKDYARGRPSARVVLADYGKANGDVIHGVAKPVRDRCEIVDELLPGKNRALVRFERLIAEAVAASVASASLPTRAMPAKTTRLSVSDHSNATATIILRWAHEPADLDLHLWVESQGQVSHVSYKELTAAGENFSATLEGDCQIAPGEEVICLNSIPEYVRCAVHNYSGRPALVAAAAFVTVVIGQRHLEWAAPVTGNGQWWLVIEFWRDPARLVTCNQITDSMMPMSTPRAQTE